ncbi:GNAT family N-acetyltransferase [Paracoccus salipaludis]|uniref:GNAT family N-acetyltransferase n=1 Tax=Paracoccus salipaludis TaxID=2032623 RepID=A0A2A2GGI6_9RHOB|nr:GNAT family protein [Paracoccus salipaludis]PAU95975.1 GNAT family N-acetyltransferase [Paracoccus salipaludis]
MDLADWSARPRPARAPLEGRYVRLEPLEHEHADTLYQAASAEGAEDRFRWLFESAPQNRAEFDAWMAHASASTDPLFFAVIDKETGRAEGRQALMRIDQAHGVIEIGNIMWGPALQQTRMATEALFLFADHIFALGYRRFEWKCNDMNAPSKRAALRFGFRPEGVFRQHMVVKSANRDTAWFAMTDQDWQHLRPTYETWLSSDNFDTGGRQVRKLEECRL